MSRLSEKKKLRVIKRVLACLDLHIGEFGFRCSGCYECNLLCEIIRGEIVKHYHLSKNLQEIC